jgi:Na+/proline symporter
MVIIYTVSGGTKAVSQTQKQQMLVILIGMGVAFAMLLKALPDAVDFSKAQDIAGHLGKMKVVDFKFDLSNRYNIWTAMLGGTFLFLSYFGTDQSQVQRYLSGKSLKESRLGLLFNGMFKVPMQFCILLVGVFVFVFYQFNQAPLHFNNYNEDLVQNSTYQESYAELNREYDLVFEAKKQELNSVVASQRENDPLAYAGVQDLIDRENELRDEARQIIKKVGIEKGEKVELEDTDYVFFTFIKNNLPVGIIGLLLAVIFSAAMSSTASELNALATTTVVDIYKRSWRPNLTDSQILKASKLFTLGWGILAIIFANTASLFDNLIEAVNIIGSLFYGSILGVFIIAFFLKKIGAKATFIAAILAEILVLTLFGLDHYEVIQLAYLWLNLIGSGAVVLFALIYTYGFDKR